jgi:hypothetical protein
MLLKSYREGKGLKPFTLDEIPIYIDALSEFAKPLAEMLLLTSGCVTAITGGLISYSEKYGVLRVKQRGGSISDIPIYPGNRKNYKNNFRV